MVRIVVSRLVRAPKSRVWSLVSDVEHWPNLAPLSAANRVVSHPVISRDGNTLVCDEYEEAGLFKAHHRDRYTLRPQEGLDETILQGDFGGGITLTLTQQQGGTFVQVEADVKPKTFWFKFLNVVLGGRRMLTQFWDDFLGQIAEVAESSCSSQTPMYCPSRMLDLYFEPPSLQMQTLVNKGARAIDLDNKTIYDDTRWKGIYPPDSRFPAWAFQNGFNKRFWEEGGSVKGITSTFDDSIQGHNRLSPIDPRDASKGILLEYEEPQYALFYDELKVTDNDLVVGKAFTGRYPNGTLLLNFTMARKYSFDFMTAPDHRELWEKFGRAPDIAKISGEWEGRMVSSASLTPPLFRFWYSVDGSGRVACKWNFMNVMKGTSKIRMTPRQLEMFDFTNFHDEIRMIAEDAMVGRYLPKSQEILKVLGDRDLGLVHLETSAEGERPAIYYYIKRVPVWMEQPPGF